VRLYTRGRLTRVSAETVYRLSGVAARGIGMVRGALGAAICAGMAVCLQAQPLPGTVRSVDPELVAIGSQQYLQCLPCHGTTAIAAGTAPDLRTSTAALAAVPFAAIVRGGALAKRGMPGFPELSNRELAGLRYYIRVQAGQALQATQR